MKVGTTGCYECQYSNPPLAYQDHRRMCKVWVGWSPTKQMEIMNSGYCVRFKKDEKRLAKEAKAKEQRYIENKSW